MRALLGGIARTIDTIFVAALEELRTNASQGAPSPGPACEAAAAESAGLTDFLRRLDLEFARSWCLSDSQRMVIKVALTSLADVGAPTLDIDGFPAATSPTSYDGSRQPERFPHYLGLFKGSLASGWPLHKALSLWAALPAGSFSTDGRTFWPAYPDPPPHQDCGPSFTISALDTTAWVLLDATGERILAVHGSHRLRLPRDPLKFVTTKPYVIPLGPDGFPIPPTLKSDSLRMHRHNWYKLGSLSAEACIIIEGRFVFPKSWWGIPILAIRRPNHPSLEHNPDAQACLFPKIIQWAEAGILEVVPADAPQPLCILPCGAVPKKPDSYRLITDGRPVNPFFLDWKVSYTAAIQMGLLLSDRCVTFSIDMHDAYHLTELAGCGQGAVYETEEYVDIDGNRRLRVRAFWGCSPRTCVGCCDKALLGIHINGITFRFASAQFGLKTSGCPLATIVKELVRYIEKTWGLAVGDWVDDLLFVLAVPSHPPCAGAEGGCAICRTAVDSCAAKEAAVKAFLPTLGIALSDKGHSSAQRGEFVGIIHDTVKGLYLVPDDRLASIIELTTTIQGLTTSTPRQLAGLRGKLGHYSIGLDYLRPVLAALSVACGTPSFPSSPLPQVQPSPHPSPFTIPCVSPPAPTTFDWDASVPVTAAVHTACQHVLDILPKVAPRGRPIWPVPTPTLFARFTDAHHHLNTTIIVISYDASPNGYAARTRFGSGRDSILLVGTLSSGLEQVHREARAAVMAVQYLVSRLGEQLRRSTVILRNDCAPALKALYAGSFRSPVLQACSWELLQLCHPLDIELRTLHVPGTVLIEEGIDHDSRLLARLCQGPACSPSARHRIFAAAAQLGVTITLDLFASSSNTLANRFYSRYAEGGSLGVDAFQQHPWGYRHCGCGSYHQEFVFAFPPEDLLCKFVARARLDQARGFALIPQSITKAYWQALLRVMVGGRPIHVFRPGDDALCFAGRWSPPKLALIHFDFGPPSHLRFHLKPPCPMSHLFNSNRPFTTPIDDLELALLRRATALHKRPRSHD